MKLSRWGLALVAGMAAIAIPRPLFAHTHLYPANSRTIFLTSCILDEDNAPDFSNREEVSERVGACVCLLEQFQQDYSHEQFTTLFGALEQGDRAAFKEMGDFFRNHVPGCLAQLER